ncbi:hypothetical protein FERRO_12570 [Ferrovum sp. JA12]|uniref:type II secretion system protein N n=1 Tax=Ferrovum sp. JA12 TaxID=1356299 RepID=UPI0007039043|nr:type II secretion system protein N [Ferrovum sp. JA12]KRH78276.1 hypothetical protein FERRO_12570 [Ferrovum sp. JA12]
MMLKNWQLRSKSDLTKQFSWFISLLILSVTVGHWASLLLAPPPQPIPVHPLDKPGNTVYQDAKNVFIGPSLLNASLVLNGVIVSDQHHGIAVISINNSPPKPYRERHEISAGILLKTVTSDHIIIERQGRSETLSLHSQPKLSNGISIEHQQQ